MTDSTIFDCFAGKTVLLQSSKTVKETILCARYLKGIESSGGTFFIEDIHGLGDVFGLINPNVSVISSEEVSNHRFDVIYSLSKLRFFMRQGRDASQCPYISAEDCQTAVQRNAIGLGLQDEETNTRIKLTEISHNITIQQQGKTRFLSFTKQPAFEENHCKMLVSQFSIQQHGYGLVASLLAEMDFVISLNNTFAHLAGALGKPVWLLVPFGSDEQSVSFFMNSYPQVTIFRQLNPGDWNQVFQNISLLRLLQPKDTTFRPFTVGGRCIQMIDTKPLPDLAIDSPEALSELLNVDVGLLTNIQIETTSICNLRCPYCPNATVGRPAGFMEESTFYNIIDSLKDFNGSYSGSIAPHFYGEPLIDKRMEAFISYARKTFPKAYLEIYTNGEFLTIDRYLSLKDAGVDIFKISQHTEMPSHTLSATLSYINQNHPELFTIDYKVFYKAQNKMNRGGLVSEKGIPEHHLENVDSCGFAHRVMTFDYIGNAIICCNDYLSQCSFGNISESTIAEIWNSRRYRKTRNLLMYGFLPVPICRACIYGKAYE